MPQLARVSRLTCVNGSFGSSEGLLTQLASVDEDGFSDEVEQLGQIRSARRGATVKQLRADPITVVP
jgi:hypothetical protein